MGLHEAAGISPPKSIRSPSDPVGRFCPIVRLVNEFAVALVAEDLCRICANQAVSRKTVEALGSSIAELLENCYAHAKTGESGFHGLAAAQAWVYGDLAQIAIVDAGIGIRARLMDNPKLHSLLRTANACELATRYGVTADESCHGGYGLTLAKDLLRANGGNLIVVSKNEAVCCNEKGVFSSRLKASWEGTLVIFEWDTSRPLDIKSVYDSWPTVRGFDDDDFWN